MRYLRNSALGLLAILVLAVSLSACAAKEIPEAYKTSEIKKAVSLVEVEGYLDLMRTKYHELWTFGTINDADVEMAIKADHDATVAWNAYVRTVDAGDASIEKYDAAIALIKTFQNIVKRWLPAILGEAPTSLK